MIEVRNHIFTNFNQSQKNNYLLLDFNKTFFRSYFFNFFKYFSLFDASSFFNFFNYFSSISSIFQIEYKITIKNGFYNFKSVF